MNSDEARNLAAIVLRDVHGGRFSAALAIVVMYLEECAPRALAGASRDDAVLEAQSLVAKYYRLTRQDVCDLILNKPGTLAAMLSLLLGTRPAVSDLSTPTVALPNAFYEPLREEHIASTDLFWRSEGTLGYERVFVIKTSVSRSALQGGNLWGFVSPFAVVRERLPNNVRLNFRDCRSPSLNGLFQAVQAGSVAQRIYIGEIPGPGPDFMLADSLAASFTVVGLNNENFVLGETLRHLELALSQRCTVVCFPELCLSPKILMAVRKWLIENNYAVNNVLGQLFPQIGLVVAGSMHELIYAQNQFGNFAYMLDGYGEIVMRHQKCNAATPQNTVEKIAPGAEINALLVAGEAHSLAVCHDFSQQAAILKVPFERVPIRRLWVPSMTNSTSAHLYRAKEFLLNQAGTVVVANQSAFASPLGVSSGTRGSSFVVTSEYRGPEIGHRPAYVPVSPLASGEWHSVYEVKPSDSPDAGIYSTQAETL